MMIWGDQGYFHHPCPSRVVSFRGGVLQRMNFALTMMNFAFKMMDFAFKMMILY